MPATRRFPETTVTGLYDNDGLFGADPVGDLDGDGVGDVIVGFCADATVGFASGAAYILSGPLVGEVSLPDARAMFVSETEWDFTGYDVAGIGDVDGDSWPDVAIAASGVDDNGDGSGAVYVLTGQASGTLGPADATVTIRGAGADDMFGYSLAGGWDADGDGVPDILVRAIGVTGSGGSYLGATYLFSGGLTGSITLADASLRVIGTKSGLGGGGALDFAGDVNDDGLDDIVFNPYLDSHTAVSLFLGGRSGELTVEDADSLFTSDVSNDCAGWGLGTRRDLDGDGPIDLAIGAPCWGSSETGRAHIFYGPIAGSYSLPDADAIVQGATSMAQFGYPAAVGDVSGDGLQDLVITQTHGAMLFLGAEP